MDPEKIFLKNAKVTTIGGQAVMDGVMMRGPDRVSLAMRLPTDEIYLKTTKVPPKSKWSDTPIIRGIIAFVSSMKLGIGTLMESADVLEYFGVDDEEEPGRFEKFLNEKFGPNAAWNIMLTASLVIAIAISVLGFIVFPTVILKLLEGIVKSSIALNLIEGFLRLLLFFLYILAISKMDEVKKLFRYHGAEHKIIHCFENGRPLTPESSHEFETLHPRCGTSFLMFVMIISLVLFSLLGWPNMLWRVLSRILLIPVIAGLSYELLKYAGCHDNRFVRILSYPGLWLQTITTAEPLDSEVEIAAVALKAVLVPEDFPTLEGKADLNGNLIEPIAIDKHGFDEDGVAPDPRHSKEFEDEQAAREARVVGRKKRDPEAEREAAFVTGEDDFDPFGLRPVVGDPHSVANVLKRGRDRLSLVENGAHDANEIFCYVMGFSHTDIYLRSKEVLSDKDIYEYEWRIEKRLSGVPLQHIIKVQEFMGIPLRINKNVLIPRPETEVLAEQAIGILRGKNKKAPAVLDLCTGSGAIGISVAYYVDDATVTMADISKDALAVARENAEINGVRDRCELIRSDFFRALPNDVLYDMIISNPPYIPTTKIGELPVEVREHEPLVALDGGVDGLEAYRVIAGGAADHLKRGGVLAVEIGCEQASAVSKIIEKNGEFKPAAVIPDLTGRDRIVVAEKKNK